MRSQTELAIVGGGPAGLAAGIEAARRGVRVTLVDLGDRPGGALAFQTHAYRGTGLRGAALGETLHQAAEAAGVTVLARTLAWGLFEDGTLGLAVEHGTASERSALLQAEAVLIATGATDRPPVFPGATLPGVLTTTAALVMWHRWRVRPGNRALVVGDDPIAPVVAQYGREAGMEINTIGSADGLRAYAGADGTLASVVWRDAVGVGERYDVDTLVLAGGMQPANELARMRDCAVVWSAPLGGYVPLRDAGMRTSAPGVFVAGDAAGIGDAGRAILQGRMAAVAIADTLGKRKHAFAALPVTLTPGSFRPLDATVWWSVRVAEVAR